MKYRDGQVVKVGDHVRLWYGRPGEKDVEADVVCSFDSNEFSDGYPREEWSYLGRGILVYSQDAGLIHYLQPERTMELLYRKK